MTQDDWTNEKLIEAWIMAGDDSQADTDLAQLNRLIAENSHVRERLILLAQEQSWLMWHGADATPADQIAEPASLALRAWSEPSQESSRSQWIEPAQLRTFAGLLALCVLTLFAVTRWNKQNGNIAQEQPIASPLQSSILKVTAGSASLDLPGVGHVALDGPTELELISPMRARLKHGRIRVRVTQATGYGFVVEYPNGKVIDLGTEFGLNVPIAGAADDRTSLVVFEGAVNLERSATTKQTARFLPAQRLSRGEGVTISSAGSLDRVMSIVTGTSATFDSRSVAGTTESDAVILDVTDNLHSSDTRKFYEIVPGGFGEDVLAYVDRPSHQWNGIDENGLPRELKGADYVKTFGDDDARTDVEMNVTIGRPAKLYVFFDDSLAPPDWLRRGFRKTKLKVGIDLGPWPEIGRAVETGVGPGKSIDHEFTVWVRTVQTPGVVTLGANRVQKNPYMYGVAAVAIDTQHPAPAADKKSASNKSRKDSASARSAS